MLVVGRGYRPVAGRPHGHRRRAGAERSRRPSPRGRRAAGRCCTRPRRRRALRGTPGRAWSRRCPTGRRAPAPPRHARRASSAASVVLPTPPAPDTVIMLRFPSTAFFQRPRGSPGGRRARAPSRGRPAGPSRLEAPASAPMVLPGVDHQFVGALGALVGAEERLPRSSRWAPGGGAPLTMTTVAVVVRIWPWVA